MSSSRSFQREEEGAAQEPAPLSSEAPHAPQTPLESSLKT